MHLFFGASAGCIQHLWGQALGQRGEAEEGQGEAQAGAGHRQIYLELLIMIHQTPGRVSRMQLGHQASVNPPDLFLKWGDFSFAGSHAWEAEVHPS